jgi:methyltransferase (TIGR00027 family)
MLTAADTAYSVAHIRAMESARPSDERLFDDPYAAIFAAAGAHAAEGTARVLALPMVEDGVRLRTRFIDDALRDAIAGGIDQVVLMGAGFDARALRMPELARARVYEVDYAAQLATKRALLTNAGIALPASIAYVPCDFNAPDFDDALARDLAARGFREGGGAFFVWEGVIAYIGAAPIDRSLRFMARAGGPHSRVVFDYAPIGLEPDPAEARVERAGFTRFATVGCDVLWRRYQSGDPPANAEVIHLGIASV